MTPATPALPATPPAPAAGPGRTTRRAWLAAACVGAAGAAGALAARQLWPGAARPAPAGAMPGDDVCLVAPPSPYEPASGLPPTAARAVPPGARCPVCGMFPARAPAWAAQLIFANGDAHFFDSPLSLFLYLQDLPRYSPGRTRAQVAARYVTDTGAGAGGLPHWIDAASAWYVHGSSARGPMRAGNLPAFATREAAEAFARARGGRVLAWAQVDAAVLAALAAPPGHGGHGEH